MGADGQADERLEINRLASPYDLARMMQKEHQAVKTGDGGPRVASDVEAIEKDHGVRRRREDLQPKFHLERPLRAGEQSNGGDPDEVLA